MGMIEKLVKICVCERCGHQWIPNNPDVMPIVCGKCKTPYWNIPRKKVKKR